MSHFFLYSFYGIWHREKRSSPVSFSFLAFCFSHIKMEGSEKDNRPGWRRLSKTQGSLWFADVLQCQVKPLMYQHHRAGSWGTRSKMSKLDLGPAGSLSKARHDLTSTEAEGGGEEGGLPARILCKWAHVKKNQRWLWVGDIMDWNEKYSSMVVS